MGEAAYASVVGNALQQHLRGLVEGGEALYRAVLPQALGFARDGPYMFLRLLLEDQVRFSSQVTNHPCVYIW